MEGLFETRMVGMRYELFRSGTDGACNTVRREINGERYDMHSGGALVPVIERSASKRDLGVVFVLQ